LEALRRTNALFGNSEDLYGIKYSLAHYEDCELIMDKVHGIVANILAVEIEDGRDVPDFRETGVSEASFTPPALAKRRG
jgi:hypothetical protein